MPELTELERAVLERLLAGDTNFLKGLRDQLATASVRTRELTGVGFFTHLQVDRATVGPIGRSGRIGDVHAEIEGPSDGAGSLVLVRDGYLEELEGFSYDEPVAGIDRRVLTEL